MANQKTEDVHCDVVRSFLPKLAERTWGQGLVVFEPNDFAFAEVAQAHLDVCPECHQSYLNEATFSGLRGRAN